MSTNQNSENKALWLSSFSAPLELVNLPIPEATSGSVVVKVLSTIIIPYAEDIHKGHLPIFNLQLPLVPHPGHVGRVHAIGPDTVTLKQGDLIYFNPFINARDDAGVFMIQGHHGGEDPRAKKLMTGEWRDGSLQQYQRIPLEGAFLLDDNRLLNELGYTPADLHEIAFYAMSVGSVCEAGKLQAGETILIGPATGTFGGITSEVALALGGNVIALGRSKEKLEKLKQQLGNHERFKYIVMTGDAATDTDAILNATPGRRGVDVYNDWAPSSGEGSPFFSGAIRAVKAYGRVILSGAPQRNIELPYAFIMHQSITIIGKLGVDRKGIQLTIDMIESGIIKLGERGGASHKLYTLEQHHEAFKDAKKGGFKVYHDIVPNKW